MYLDGRLVGRIGDARLGTIMYQMSVKTSRPYPFKFLGVITIMSKSSRPALENYLPQSLIA